MMFFPYLVAFFAVACYAVMGPVAKKVSSDVQPFTFMAVASFFVVIISGVFALICERTDAATLASKINWSWMGVYVLCNFVSYTGYLWAITRIPVAQFEMFGIFVPIIGGFFAWLILHEPFHARYLLAIAVMALGLFIAIKPDLKVK
ncbi:MAG: hypothetical protein DI626_03365 [Micavibrio aeruginosavorus]|uniref:EamA domain-containing protein n=1 Tax=Micavibrio aeruginosavorus TaxID=349221 RepID=A0A2W5A2Z9_9BACT|nr:MAG: hypothetical protein DI626_03365 [Micavibrio aeruginosavorus]